MAKAKPKPAPAAPRREPREDERAAMAAATERVKGLPLRPGMKVTRDGPGAVSTSAPHSDGHGFRSQLQAAFGTRSFAYADEAMLRLMASAGDGRVKDGSINVASEDQFNAALALVAACDPQNELEAAIAEQIAAAHIASLGFLIRARSNAGEYVNTANTYTNMATKLSRTMAAHIEALAKLRSGGKQTHEVRYIYVNGPAAFGSGAKAAAAYGGEGVRGENLEQPHASAALGRDPGAPCPPVWGQDAEGDALSVASGGGPETVQDARGDEPRCPSGEG